MSPTTLDLARQVADLHRAMRQDFLIILALCVIVVLLVVFKGSR